MNDYNSSLRHGYVWVVSTAGLLLRFVEVFIIVYSM